MNTNYDYQEFKRLMKDHYEEIGLEERNKLRTLLLTLDKDIKICGRPRAPFKNFQTELPMPIAKALQPELLTVEEEKVDKIHPNECMASITLLDPQGNLYYKWDVEKWE